MRDAGVTIGKMQGKELGTTHSLPTCSVIAIGRGRRMSTMRLASLRLVCGGNCYLHNLVAM